jgi:hypothetical protein
MDILPKDILAMTLTIITCGCLAYAVIYILTLYIKWRTKIKHGREQQN